MEPKTASENRWQKKSCPHGIRTGTLKNAVKSQTSEAHNSLEELKLALISTDIDRKRSDEEMRPNPTAAGHFSSDPRGFKVAKFQSKTGFPDQKGRLYISEWKLFKEAVLNSEHL